MLNPEYEEGVLKLKSFRRNYVIYYIDCLKRKTSMVVNSLLDIRPYVKDLDSKADANYGWINDLGSGKEHRR